MKKYIIIIFITILIIILLIFYLIPRKITYYKCSEKPNNPLLSGIFQNHKINLKKIGFDLYLPCGYNTIESQMAENIFYGNTFASLNQPIN